MTSQPSRGLLQHILIKADALFLKKFAGYGTGDNLMAFLKIWYAEVCFSFWKQRALSNCLPEKVHQPILLQTERSQPGQSLTKLLFNLLSVICFLSGLNKYAELLLGRCSTALSINTTSLVILSLLESISNISHFPMSGRLLAWHGGQRHGTLAQETVSLAGQGRSGKRIFI